MATGLVQRLGSEHVGFGSAGSFPAVTLSPGDSAPNRNVRIGSEAVIRSRSAQ